MPLYVFRCERCGRTYERAARADALPAEMRIGAPNRCENGDCPGVAYRDMHAEHTRQWFASGTWPMESSAAGVAPHQRAAAAAADAALGVPTEYNERGRAIFRDKGHRRNWCRAHGRPDLDGGYGDFTGVSRT